MIPLAKPNIGQEEREAVDRVLRSGQLTCGKECELFEQELCEYLGAKYAIVVSSGTAALHLSLMVLGIKNRKQFIIVPDFTYPATANIVELVGATPLFSDVELDTYNMSKKTYFATCSETMEQTKGKGIVAVMPVYQFGLYAPVILDFYRFKVIEDASCAIGAKQNDGKFVGNSDNLTCFSFHPRKNLTTGEGGAIATNNRKLAFELKCLRQGGNGFFVGLNYKMTDIQAAMGRVQLGKLDDTIEEKRNILKWYEKKLYERFIYTRQSLWVDYERPDSFQNLMITLPKNISRNQVIIKMGERGIETSIGSYALHQFPYYRNKYPEQYERLKNSNSTILAGQGLSLPLYCGMTEENVEYVCNNLLECINE